MTPKPRQEYFAEYSASFRVIPCCCRANRSGNRAPGAHQPRRQPHLPPMPTAPAASPAALAAGADRACRLPNRTPAASGGWRFPLPSRASRA